MYSRLSEIIWAGTICLALAACGDKAPDAAYIANSAIPANGDDGKVECAIGKDAEWRRTCLVDRSDGADGSLITLRHPEGGFRRFRTVSDGRGLIPADGSEKAHVALITDQRIEITIGEDRYRLPATIEASRR